MKRHQTILLMALFLVALGIRISYLSNTEIINPIRADALKYVTIADNLVHTGVYSEGHRSAKSSYFITPGYPFFLAAIIKVSKNSANAYNLALHSQAAMGAAITVLAVLIALNFLPFRFAYMAGILTAVSPHLITLGSYILTETLFTFLLMLALLMLLRGLGARDLLLLVGAGVLFGCAALVRPSIIAFPLFVVPLLVWSPQGRDWRAPTVLILAALVVFGSWVGWTKFHAAQASTSNSKSLLSNSMALGIYPDLTYQNPKMKGYPYREDPSFNNFANDLRLTLQTMGQRFQNEPLRYANWYLFGKPAMFWSKDILVGQGGIYVYPVSFSLYDANIFAHGTMEAMQFLHPYLLFFVMAGAILLFFICRQRIVSREKLTMVFIIYALLCYITLVHMALAPLPRYSIPFRPALYIAFSAALYYCTTIMKKHVVRLLNLASRLNLRP